MEFDELLEIIKEEFEVYRALIVLDDKALRRYVMSWGPQLVRRVSTWPAGDTITDLWGCVHVDYQALADLTGHSLPAVMGHFRQAQGLQLIYPDGTVPDAVTQMLRKEFKKITAL